MVLGDAEVFVTTGRANCRSFRLYSVLSLKITGDDPLSRNRKIAGLHCQRWVVGQTIRDSCWSSGSSAALRGLIWSGP